MSNTDILNDQNAFEERADYLEISDLLNWNVETPFFEEIQHELLAKGAKLLVGPRGTGKTHQMRFAYDKCINSKQHPLAIYVSFGKYYHLEPFLVSVSNATQIFHTWVLAKVILGAIDALKTYSENEVDEEEYLGWKKSELINYISEVETGYRAQWHDDIMLRINCEKTIFILEKVAEYHKRKRVVLLLDDAALTLTPDYLIEFFDVFRSLRTHKISPKASVYPGTTQYGPRFHVGHDAQKVDMWFCPNDPNYLEFMKKVVDIRFPDILENGTVSSDFIDLFIYIAFGVPRAFIKLLSAFTFTKEKTTSQSKFNKVLQNHIDDIENEYNSLSQKLPQYKTVVTTGWALVDRMFDKLVDENVELTSKESKQLLIGIQQEKKPILTDRMISFLIEAGLLFPQSAVKHGKDRVYDRYLPHLAFLIQRKAFSGGSRGFSPRAILNFLNRTPEKHPSRIKIDNLIEDDVMNLQLDLPPCGNCGTMRLAEEQRFCHNCGSQLVNKSNFEQCMDISIDDLPLSSWRKEKISSDTDIKVIRDIISSENPARELQKAHRIGPKRADDTFNVVERFVEEFLA